MKISEGFPKVLDQGGVTAKIYKGFIKGKYDLFTLAYYMDGQLKKANFGSLDDAIARGKQVIRQLKGGEFDGVVMTSQDTKAYFASLKNLEGTGLSLESATKEIAACHGVLRGQVPPLVACRDYARRNDETVLPRTVSQVVTEFLAAKEAGCATRIKGKGKTVSERYLYDLRKKLEKVSAHFNGLLIGLVTAEEINRFVNELRGVTGRPTKKGKDGPAPKPVSGRTKNNYLQAINVLLEYAKKQKRIKLRPANTDRVNGWAEVLQRFGDLDGGITPTLFLHRRCGRLVETVPVLQHDSSMTRTGPRMCWRWIATRMGWVGMMRRIASGIWWR